MTHYTILAQGKRGLRICLPPAWCAERGIRKGTTLYCTIHDPMTAHIMYYIDHDASDSRVPTPYRVQRYNNYLYVTVPTACQYGPGIKMSFDCNDDCIEYYPMYGELD